MTTHNSSSLAPRAEVSKAELLLQDGSRFPCELFGSRCSRAGEVVFNTGMVGYPEAMTDPSYRWQNLVLTYPLIGNYGVPVNAETKPSANDLDIPEFFESNRIQISGLIIATLSKHYSHWSALDSLDLWMQRQNIPGICNIDTRMLTKKLRSQGMMLGKIVADDMDIAWEAPNESNLVAEASDKDPRAYPGTGQKIVILVDFGCTASI